MDTRPLLAGIRHHPNAHDGGGDDDDNDGDDDGDDVDDAGDDDVGDGEEEEEENCKRIDLKSTKDHEFQGRIRCET